jgi:hypothetical protein
LAAQAQQAGQQNVAFGAGLFGTGGQLLGQYQAGQVGALSPFTSYLGSGQAIEGLGQESLRLGSELGGRASTAGANAGEFLFRGGANAALSRQIGSGQSPISDVIAGGLDTKKLQTGFERLFGGYGQPVQTGYTGAPTMSPDENTLLAQQGTYYNQPQSSFSYDGSYGP